MKYKYVPIGDFCYIRTLGLLKMPKLDSSDASITYNTIISLESQGHYYKSFRLGNGACLYEQADVEPFNVSVDNILKITKENIELCNCHSCRFMDLKIGSIFCYNNDIFVRVYVSQNSNYNVVKLGNVKTGKMDIEWKVFRYLSGTISVIFLGMIKDFIILPKLH